MNKQYIAVPAAIEDTLRAFGKPLTILKDPVALANTLSRNEVALYWLANNILGEVLPSYVFRTLYSLGYDGGTYFLWKDAEPNFYTEKVLPYTATYPEKYPRVVADGGTAKDPEFPDTFEGNYFADFFDIDSDTVGIRLHVCKADAIPPEQKALGMTVQALTMGGLLEYLKPRFRADELIATDMVNEITLKPALYGTLLKDGRKL